MIRTDGRSNGQLRPVTITLNAQPYAEGSVIIETGQTKVLCAVSVEERVPQFMRGIGKGWVTAEYAMLPRSTLTRTPRESRTRGRTHEIQRLIGRSLRAVVDMEKLGERTLTVDCDVLQADGGTRTAAITGSFIALQQACANLVKNGKIKDMPIRTAVAATSVGIIQNEVILDLCYEEDFAAEVDFNIVMTGDGHFVEVQGTAEGEPFSQENLDDVLKAAKEGISELLKIQKETLQGI